MRHPTQHRKSCHHDRFMELAFSTHSAPQEDTIKLKTEGFAWSAPLTFTLKKIGLWQMISSAAGKNKKAVRCLCCHTLQTRLGVALNDMSRCCQTGQVTGTLSKTKNMVFSIWPKTTGHWKQNPQHIPPKLGVPLQKKTALSVWPKKLDIENKTLKHIPPQVRPQKKNKSCLSDLRNWAFKTKPSTHSTQSLQATSEKNTVLSVWPKPTGHSKPSSRHIPH